MNKLIYTDLKSRIETLTQIKTVGLFNNQFANENQEKPFVYPAVFIEFSDITFETENQGIKKIKLETTLHVGMRQLVEDLELFDIVQAVSAVVDGYTPDYSTPYIKVREVHDVDHDNVLVWNIVFVSTVTDENSSRFNDLTITTPTTIQINRSVDIDNIIIRTGDGV
jgi:hypothetical protein